MSDKDPQIITLPEVRLSFPALWVPVSMDENAPKEELQYEATFLFDNTKHGALLDEIDKKIDRVALDEWKKPVNGLMRCLRDGNERSQTEGYGDGVSFLCARNKTRPGVVDRRLSPITEADNIIYAGCYVNATIRIFAWEFRGKKGVSASLRAVQFVKDGPSFGAGPVDPSQEFTAYADETTGEAGRNRQRSTPGRSGTASKNLDDY